MLKNAGLWFILIVMTKRRDLSLEELAEYDRLWTNENARKNYSLKKNDPTYKKLPTKLGTEEWRHRISVGRKGISGGPRPHLIASNKSKEKIEKNRARRLGSHHSEETKRKIGLKHKGKIVSSETRKKLSDFRKSHVGWKHSKETKKKMSLAQKGSKSYNWRGGLKLLSEGIRKNYIYRQWVSDVLTRDCFTCVSCGSKEKLEAHHIKPMSSIIHSYKIKCVEDAFSCNELWDINNGITYCYECHKKHDKHRH